MWGLRTYSKQNISRHRALHPSLSVYRRTSSLLTLIKFALQRHWTRARAQKQTAKNTCHAKRHGKTERARNPRVGAAEAAPESRSALREINIALARKCFPSFYVIRPTFSSGIIGKHSPTRGSTLDRLIFITDTVIHAEAHFRVSGNKRLPLAAKFRRWNHCDDYVGSLFLLYAERPNFAADS